MVTSSLVQLRLHLAAPEDTLVLGDLANPRTRACISHFGLGSLP